MNLTKVFLGGGAGFGVTAGFLLALSLMPKFFPHFFITGLRPVDMGLVKGL